MNQIRGIVIATLLAAWCFPAIGAAKTPSASPPRVEPAAAGVSARAATATEDSRTADLAVREARARELQDFRGGGVYIYVGSGVLLVAVIILVIILVV